MDTKDWEKELENEFNWLGDVTITPRQAGDAKKAELLQNYYRDSVNKLKDFIRSIESAAFEAGQAAGRHEAVDHIEKNCDPQMGIASHVLEAARQGKIH